MHQLAFQLQQWAAEYDYELDIETAAKFCTPQLQEATNHLIATKLEKIQRLNLPLNIPKLEPPLAKNVLNLYEREAARLDVKQTEERIAVVKENIKLLQKNIAAAKATIYTPIASKFMPKANDLVVDSVPLETLRPVMLGTTRASRYLKELRKAHVLSYARAKNNIAVLAELTAADTKPDCYNLLQVREYLQTKVNELVQIRIDLQTELEEKRTIPDLYDDVKEHIILLAQAHEQFLEMFKAFFAKVNEVGLTF
jgi:hypothetical protein